MMPPGSATVGQTLEAEATLYHSPKKGMDAKVRVPGSPVAVGHCVFLVRCASVRVPMSCAHWERHSPSAH